MTTEETLKQAAEKCAKELLNCNEIDAHNSFMDLQKEMVPIILQALCTVTADLVKERDGLQERLTAQNRLNDLAISNQERWMRKFDDSQAELRTLRESDAKTIEELKQCCRFTADDKLESLFGNNIKSVMSAFKPLMKDTKSLVQCHLCGVGIEIGIGHKCEPSKSSGGGETPRTENSANAYYCECNPKTVVNIDFARSLERELNEAKANLESYRMECHSDYFKTTLNKLQNVLSEFKRQPSLEIQERIFEAHKIIEEALK